VPNATGATTASSCSTTLATMTARSPLKAISSHIFLLAAMVESVVPNSRVPMELMQAIPRVDVPRQSEEEIVTLASSV